MATKSSFNASELEIFALFSDYLDGKPEQPALVVSHTVLATASRSALQKTFASFGKGDDACLFATLLPRGVSGRLDGAVSSHDAAVVAMDTATLTSSGSTVADTMTDPIPLDPHALFLLVEGIDPHYVIAADRTAVEALSETYRQPFPLNAPARIFGRPGATFDSLDALMTTPEGKQKAWSILKSLKS